jgi:hypothetical protein
MLKKSILSFALSCTLVLTVAAQQGQAAAAVVEGIVGENQEKVINQEIAGRIQDIIARQAGSSTLTEIEEFTKIIMFVFASALTYGILHDQVTVRVNRDYFCANLPGVQHHRNGLLRLGLNPDTLPDTAVAGVWGVLATWMPGLILAFEIAMVARFGNKLPKLAYQELFKTVGYAMAVMGGVSLIAGCFGYLTNEAEGRCTKSFHFNAQAHRAGYAVAGVIVLIAPAWLMYQRAVKLEQELVAA